MKNYLQMGDMIKFTAAAAHSSGDFVVVNKIGGFVANDVANGAEGEMKTTGVFKVAKATGQAWAIGNKLYWDSGNSNFTTTASGNTLVGVAVSAQVNADVEGDLRLDGKSLP